MDGTVGDDIDQITNMVVLEVGGGLNHTMGAELALEQVPGTSTVTKRVGHCCEEEYVFVGEYFDYSATLCVHKCVVEHDRAVCAVRACRAAEAQS